MNRWMFALLCAILVPASAQAQCQTFPAIPYGSYVDGGGRPRSRAPTAFLVTRTGSTASALTADVSPAGTATDGLDYAALPLTVTFDPGINRVTVP